MSSYPHLTLTDRAYRREKALAAYHGGARVVEAAERYGLTKRYVQTLVRKAAFDRARRSV